MLDTAADLLRRGVVWVCVGVVWVRVRTTKFVMQSDPSRLQSAHSVRPTSSKWPLIRNSWSCAGRGALALRLWLGRRRLLYAHLGRGVRGVGVASCVRVFVRVRSHTCVRADDEAGSFGPPNFLKTAVGLQLIAALVAEWQMLATKFGMRGAVRAWGVVRARARVCACVRVSAPSSAFQAVKSFDAVQFKS